MNILIIESPSLNSEQLKSCIMEVKPDCSFLPIASSMDDGLFIMSDIMPDAIFMDLDNAGNQDFAVFRKTTNKSPIVFTTTDLSAPNGILENDGICYVIRPFEKNMIAKALRYIEKFRALSSSISFQSRSSITLFKSRFLVKQGQKLIPVKTAEINHFASDGSLVYMITVDKRKYVVDEPLSELDAVLDPSGFFRVNRKFILSKDAILSLDYYTKGQVAVRALLLESERIIVSRQQTPALKQWLSF